MLDIEGLEVIACGSLLELHQAALTGAHVAIADTWGPSYLVLEETEREQIQALAVLVPTILLSARTWVATAVPAELGLVAIVSKPFEMDELLGHVKRVVRLRRSTTNSDRDVGSHCR